MTTTTKKYDLKELNLETTFGGMGKEIDRDVPVIDLTDFEHRRQEITEQLWIAATEVGFFQLANHGLELAVVRKAFQVSERFFELPEGQKSQYPLKKGLNAGWEFMSQVRPSTGTADQKESFQITLPHMDDLWPNQTIVPEFHRVMLDMEYQAWQLGMKVLSCFADRLGFARDFFTQAHDRALPDYQSTLRLLHYLPLADEAGLDESIWRAGAHTDFDCLTMVFQQTGQGGLQVSPGKDAEGKGDEREWFSVLPKDDLITCNIGDMLMRWSDDRLKSTLHRVRMPRPGEYNGSRYSLAFFCQANKDVMIESPQGKYPPISARDYLLQRIKANFDAAAEKAESQKQ
ncbi:isopenicillin N synthase family dioxygenase [Hydrocarboniclastica marina]|uniref:2-oxoglutarate-dependent ethylene/succinate-forming enzyme n=1 Tax=Hydrocarboniclastica marina TaxID=2259620 RepID=A0A4P7XMR5_9ALTE|nr:2-oxoglutarate and iron-dependent oxygenase domain-containing protein [Hydrocarboniclastica marina]MAM00161.1 2OG-Fe(II) oxygenase [Alteromonadaceae bacterium]QCF27467.1 isopenicillin N synthase family oxygenase [Hydrocarboniclastica marina]